MAASEWSTAVSPPLAGSGGAGDSGPSDPISFPTVVLDIPARKEYVALVRQVVSIIAGRDGLLETNRVDDLCLAASEACTNAIEAYGSDRPAAGGEETRVIVHVVEIGNGVTVAVDDSGPGFNPSSLDPGAFRADEHPAGGKTDSGARSGSRSAGSWRSERGRGVSLIKALVDEVTFESSSGGTSVTMMMRGPSR